MKKGTKINLLKLFLSIIIGVGLALLMNLISNCMDSKSSLKSSSFNIANDNFSKLKNATSAFKGNRIDKEYIYSIIGRNYTIELVDSLSVPLEYIIEPNYTNDFLFIFKKDNCNLFITSRIVPQ